MKIGTLLIGFLFFTAIHAQQTAVPRFTYFSGTQRNSAGLPQTGSARITFALYEEREGGEALWSETQEVKLDAQGRYTVLLGATQADGMPLDVFASGKARWLGVEPQTEGMASQPRTLLVVVPYALKSVDADTLGGLPPSAYLRSGAGAPVAADSTALPRAMSGVSPDTACSSVTSDGTATENQLAVFTGSCNIEPSGIAESGGKVGIGTSPSATAALAVKGGTTLGGSLSMTATGTATASAGKNSFPMAFDASAYNSTTSKAVAQVFQWEAQATGNDTAAPSAGMSLLYGAGGATPADTGFSVGSNGLVNFAPGQIFPGTGPGTITGITAGAGLSGGGTSGNVTLTNTGLAGLTAGSGILSTGGTNPTVSLNTAYISGLYLPVTGGELTGSLGIGEATPYTLLHIRKDLSGKLGPSMTLMNGAGGVGAGGSVDFDGYDPGSTSAPAARIQSLDDGSYSAHLTFQTKTSGADSNPLVERMRITDVGSVGIGTTSPSGQLGVAVQSPVPAIAAQGWTAPVGSTSDASPAIEANGGNSSTGNRNGLDS